MRKPSSTMINKLNRIHTIVDIDLFTYGFNILLRYILFGITTAGLLILFGNIKYILFYDLILIILRFHCGGFHAKNTKVCFFLSIIALVLLPEIALNYTFGHVVNLLLVIFTTIFMIFIYPIHNEKKSLNRMFIEKINKRKNIFVFCFSCLYFLFLNISNTYAIMIMWAFICNVFSMFFQLKRKEKK